MGDTAKAYGLTTDEIKKLTRLLPRSFYHLLAQRTYSEQELFDKLSEQFTNPVYRTIFSQAQSLIGIPPSSIRPCRRLGGRPRGQ